jgi:DNA repair protein RecN (Recombination protein N)
VAAHADHHFHVDKSLSRRGGKQRARSQLRKLDEGERVEELARMLGGKRVTKKARDNARELIAAAK